MPNGFFWTKLAKKMSKTEKKNITIEFYIFESLGTKFLLKLTILNFWTKLTEKGYFQSKKE